MITGIQVSSLKPVLTTEEEVQIAFQKMQEMGCDTVQLQWIDYSVPVDSVVKSMKECGIRSVSVQDFYETVMEKKEYYMELMRKSGSEWMCVSRVPQRLKSKLGLYQFVEELRTFARELEAEGMKLCFHPTSPDYQMIEGVEPVEFLMEEMPELYLCVDLYHLNLSGHPMAAFLRSYAGRVCMVHFKDAVTLEDGTEQLVPAGQGEVNWDGVVQACEEIGVDCGFVEQERWRKDPFESLREALDWLRKQ